MEPSLRDGDEIIVDRSLRTMRAGIHVIRLDDVLLVKGSNSVGLGRIITALAEEVPA
jgi:phage repressor protein C with HTH and peptisase S24 domain